MAAFLDQVFAAGGVAVAHGGTGNIRTYLGLAVDLDAFETFARQHDIQQRALDTFIQRVLQKNVPLEEAEATLADVAALHLRTRAELQALRPHGEANLLRAQAAEALEEGRLEDAEALLEQVSDLATANAEAAQLAAREAMREQARTAALQGNLRLMQLDYSGAALAWRRAAALLPPGEALAAEYLAEVASAERRVGRYASAIAAADQALTMALSPAALARAWQERSRSLRDSGRYKEAAAAISEAIALAEGTDIAELRIDAAGLLVDRGRLKEAAAALQTIIRLDGSPGPAARRTLSAASHTLGRLLGEQGRFDEAAAALTQAIAIVEDAVPSGHPDLIRFRSDLAYIQRRRGRLNEAAALYETARIGFALVFGEEHPEYVTLLDHLAGLAADQHKWHLARGLYERAIALGRTALGPDHPDMGQAWNNLGLVLRDLGESEPARTAFEEAARIFEDSSGPDHPDTATALHNLADTLLQLGQIKAAEALGARALEVRQLVLGPNHQATADSLMQRAILRQTKGEQTAALSDQEAAWAILRLAKDAAPNRAVQALAGLARLHLENGSPLALALAPARQAVFLARRAVPPSPPLLALALNNLGHATHAAGKERRAIRILEAGLAACRVARSGDHAEVVLAVMNLAAVSASMGDNIRSLALNREAASMAERLWPVGHHLTAAALNNLGKTLERVGEAEAAGPLYRRAAHLSQCFLGPDHPQTGRIEANLAQWENSGRPSQHRSDST